MITLVEIVEELVSVPAQRSGGSCNFPCPFCGEGKDRFIVWRPAHDKPTGTYHCRICNRSGDGISFVRERFNLTYEEACKLFAVEVRTRVFKQITHSSADISYTEAKKPPQKWQEHAARHLAQFKKDLKHSDHALHLIKTRGISDLTAERFHIGYNDVNRFEAMDAWGLSQKLKQNGKEQVVWLPRGLVVARFDVGSGVLIGMKIRRDEWKEGDKLKKYAEITGSANCPGIYGNTFHKIAIVVESEFDAILIQQEAEDLCHSLSIGGAGGKKLDRFTYHLLNQCSLILLSFDCDKAGHAEVKRWEKIFPNAKYWPASIGKSPGDAHLQGENLRLWLEVAIREYAFMELPGDKNQK